jgi:hypothetical protein
LAEVAAERGTTPADLRRALRGELTWIVGRCLELDRQRRYPSVAHLAEDLNRYLTGHPVDAGPHGPLYTLRRFAKRHRRSLILSSSLTVAVAAVVWGISVRREYGPDSRHAIRQEMAAAIDRGNQEIGGELPMLRTTYEKALRVLGPHDPLTVDVLVNLVLYHHFHGDTDETLTLAAELHKTVLGGSLDHLPLRAADLSDWYGGTYYLLGRWAEAEAPLADSIVVHERVGVTHTRKYRMLLEELAGICERLGRPADAARWRAKLAVAVAATQKSH